MARNRGAWTSGLGRPPRVLRPLAVEPTAVALEVPFEVAAFHLGDYAANFRCTGSVSAPIGVEPDEP